MSYYRELLKKLQQESLKRGLRHLSNYTQIQIMTRGQAGLRSAVAELSGMYFFGIQSVDLYWCNQTNGDDLMNPLHS